MDSSAAPIGWRSRSADAASVALLAALLLLAACSHTPADPSVKGSGLSYESPTYRAGHPPYGRLAIDPMKDERPGHEYGRTDYLKFTYVSDRLYDRPVNAMMKRLLAKELRDSGAFDVVDETAAASYLLEVGIRHFHARYETSALAITLVLPSISVDAELEIQVVLRDQDGRRFLDKVYRGKDDGLAVALEGAIGECESLLNGLLTRFTAEMVKDADQSVPAFWKALGKEVPR